MDILVFESSNTPSNLPQALAAEGHRVKLLAADDGVRSADVLVVDADQWSADAATKLARRLPNAELIFLVGSLDHPLPSEAAMALLKPVDVNKLVRLLRVVDQARTGQTDPRDLLDFETLFSGDSPAIVELLRQVRLLAQSDAPVWLHGELGSGRSVVARAIHDRSARAGKGFLAVNAATFPGDLLEAHLFVGAEPLVQRAQGGSLFIDCVTELAPGVQARLLRLLEDRQLRGFDQPADVRVMVGDERRTLNVGGRLRRELYYRLKVHEVDLPPLRVRARDLTAIIKRMLERLQHDGKQSSLSASALKQLEAYPFPGNIRELAHALTHAAVLAQDGTIEPSHLPVDIQRPRDEPDLTSLESLDAVAKRFERDYLLRVLRAVAGNRTRAAKILNLSRKGLWQKLKAHGIAPEEGRDDDLEL
ncbi:MAG TPA: sigma 54-interacting transcriptional regulator [Kofleriaceae bacterium]